MLLFVSTIIFFIIFIGVILFQQNQFIPASSLQTQNSSQTNQKITSVPTVTLAPLSGSAQQAAWQFYNYYFSTPQNPLAVGKYKSNPYLSQDFKDNIETGYDNGNVPVFCPQNKSANIVVGNGVQVYRLNQYMTEETISEASPAAKDLYTIMLENNNGSWLVEDVNCLN